MLEALWSVEFVSTQGADGAGVVIFETGRIFGGDSQYYYIGSAHVGKDGILHADLEVTHYAGNPYTVFGQANQIHLKLEGKVQEPVMELLGYPLEDPNQKILVRCTKRTPLP